MPIKRRMFLVSPLTTEPLFFGSIKVSSPINCSYKIPFINNVYMGEWGNDFVTTKQPFSMTKRLWVEWVVGLIIA